MDYTAVGIHDFYTFLLVFARVSGLVVTAPLVGNKTVPHSVRAGFAIVFTLALVPLVAPLTGPVPSQLLVLVGDVLKNALFGLTLGYMARLLFSAVEIAGFFIDTQMGFGFINLFNPFADHPDSVLSMFQFQLATTLFLLSNGHLLLLGAMADSFTALPPGAISSNATLGLSIIPVLKALFTLGFRLALPVTGVLLVADVAFGLIARLVPQINVFIVGIPAKIIIGLATVALLLPVMAIVVGQITTGATASMHALVAGAK